MSPIAERFHQAASRFSELVDAVPAGAWDNQSPCTDWTAAGVLDHVVSTEIDFLRQRGLPVPEIDGLSLQRSWRAVRDAVQTVLDDPTTATIGYDGYFGPTTIEVSLDNFYSLDLLVHRWDLAKAVGDEGRAHLSDAELATIDARVGEFPHEVMRMPGLFGPIVEPDPLSDATTRAMNFLGRTA